METIRKEFKEFVLSEKNTIDLNILVDEFDFSIPDCAKSFYHELFENRVTSRKIQDSYVELTLEAPLKEGFLYFNALFEMATLKALKFTFSKNHKRKIQELAYPFNIFFVLFGNIRYYKEDLSEFEKIYDKYKFGWLRSHYDDILFFPIKDFRFSYKDMRVL
jgi:hypothetical protein